MHLSWRLGPIHSFLEQLIVPEMSRSLLVFNEYVAVCGRRVRCHRAHPIDAMRAGHRSSGTIFLQLYTRQ
jgi:hypothetical protein